ncbi:hypothetical protein [Natranaeroarchaeum aerophilus]|uniref:Uncharacterized protein n=1 Tax=Natranaeroarchaeum aerophilus TaxID=2917711 RepID=A0AAE3FTN8_9EURY|nr:hypothetical protein [Natranaeroarchaeum aerophilus]MCL9814414.1 hypothetical protein [Natranaeroarchaeum aerophilus]
MTDADDENERVQITVWVDEDKRDKWDEYTDELGFESRGALIRNAVRYFYFSQTQAEGQRILNRLDTMEERDKRTESKLDSVKIDQLEETDIDIIAAEVEHAVASEIKRIFGDVDSIEDIPSPQSDDL